jgi:hypothetical protein
MAIIQGVAGLAQTGIGISQQVKAKREMKNLRMPKMVMPSGVMAQKDVLQMLSSQDQMPGQSLANQALDYAVQSRLGDAARSGMSSQDQMALLAMLGQSAMEQQGNMAMQAAQNKNESVRQYGEFMGGTYADMQNQLYQNNYLNPYMMKLQALSAKAQTGANNVSGGLATIGSMMSGSGSALMGKSQTGENKASEGIGTAAGIILSSAQSK